MEASDQIDQSPHVVSYDSTSSGQPGEGFEVWHELCRPLFMTEALGKVREYQSKYAFSEVGGMIFTRTLYSATRYVRTPERVDAGNADGAVLHLYWKGKEKIQLYNKIHEMAPDRIVLHDWGHPYVSEATDADQLSVFIPPHLLQNRQGIYGKSPVITWMLDSLEGQLLATTLTKVWSYILTHGTKQVEDAASGFIGLLNGLIDARLRTLQAPSESLPISALMIKSYLLRRLGDPGLSVETLCKAFQCSRATIYRHFSDVGGVTAFIQDQRLEACLREVRGSGPAKPTIREIARRWGFEDITYFHRLFKQKYQMTPGDASRSMNRDVTTQDGSELEGEQSRNIGAIHKWFGVRTAE